MELIGPLGPLDTEQTFAQQGVQNFSIIYCEPSWLVEENEGKRNMELTPDEKWLVQEVDKANHILRHHEPLCSIFTEAWLDHMMSQACCRHPLQKIRRHQREHVTSSSWTEIGRTRHTALEIGLTSLGKPRHCALD